MSALVQYEPLVDDTTERFLDQTERLYVSRGVKCDFAEWLQFYAFDVIGNITYSKPHGFVDRAEDVDGMVGWLRKQFSYVAPVCFCKFSLSLGANRDGRLGRFPFLIFLFPRTLFSSFSTSLASCLSHFLLSLLPKHVCQSDWLR